MPKTIFTGDNRTVVEALRQARLQAGLKQAELAARIGKDQSWVSLVEGSQRRVDVVEFIEIAKALDVDPVKLLREILGRLG
ncbi:MAG: helix-turn-helix transcriptional regulator [Novosphingobium sp.]|uniref:helix-turn-helix domain-containing protein n=1 Tax=Tsuneonella sp. CC-YZS046 TaxID=3042152 RepID=UPI002D769F24|nr:helix-turn-helix transcriptional regulator [Tsuneonella sp. CC-YZS046]WRO65078.1 helix-turn-helix transcriptional regulator [Tsuneonella sp. CC-YZS046]